MTPAPRHSDRDPAAARMTASAASAGPERAHLSAEAIARLTTVLAHVRLRMWREEQERAATEQASA